MPGIACQGRLARRLRPVERSGAVGRPDLLHPRARGSTIRAAISPDQPERPDDVAEELRFVPMEKMELLGRRESAEPPKKAPAVVRVRLSVHYRVHSRQILCIGGSQIPFGWSFLSIAKVPMTWNPGDVWSCELDLPVGLRIEYKYVIMEEQDWTQQVSEDAEGLVAISYRTAKDAGRPPDVQVIQKQMAIVAWQPGPNRVLLVPTEAELAELPRGDLTVERQPAKPSAGSKTGTGLSPPVRTDPYEGTSETLSVDGKGTQVLDRRDVWGWTPTQNTRPPNMKGFNFGN